jgi:hypothetical protein
MSTIHAGGTDAARDPRTAFAELGKIMLGEQQLSETLGKVAELAKQTLPGAAEVSVTLMQDSDGGSVWSRAGANHRQTGEPPAEGCGDCEGERGALLPVVPVVGRQGGGIRAGGDGAS